MAVTSLPELLTKSRQLPETLAASTFQEVGAKTKFAAERSL
jgi:hypothetical protein